MNQAIDVSASGAGQLVRTCRGKLEQLNQAVQQRRWQQAVDLAGNYALLLQQIDGVARDSAMYDELVQLDIHHRRIMRLLANYMSAVNEDIQSLAAGQKAAQRSLTQAEIIFDR